MKIKMLMPVMLVIGFTAFVSCEKEGVLLDATTPSIRTFSTLEEYTDEINKVANMSYEDLCAYEKKNGYYSFGRKCEEVYLQANPKNFNSKEEFISFVENNSDYIELVTDSDGETSLEVKSRLNNDRYLVGDDGLYRIGNTIYKLIGNGNCCTSVDNIDALKNVSINNYHNSLNDKSISFSASLNSNEKWGSDIDETTSVDGNNRVKIEYLFDCTGYLIGDEDTEYHPFSYMRLNCIAKSQNKVLWIWYNCTRTMSIGVDAKLVEQHQDHWDSFLIDYEQYNSSPTYNISKYETFPMTDVNTGTLTFATYQSHFMDWLYFWGDNASVQTRAEFNIDSPNDYN